MAVFVYKDYEISIWGAPPYTIGSADNKVYDRVIIVEDYEYNKQLEFRVDYM